jgi:hypothetical protein
MPPQIYERVGQWTHKPWSNFNHKKHLPMLPASFYFQHQFNPKIQKIFTFLQSYQKPKYTFTLLHYSHISFTLLYCIVIYFTPFVILFTYIQHLVLDNHSVELGKQDKEIALQVAWRERRELFWLFPESSMLILSYPRGKNLLMLQHSALGVPTKWNIAECHQWTNKVITWFDWQDLYSMTLLEFMGTIQFRCNMISDIALNVPYFSYVQH